MNQSPFQAALATVSFCLALAASAPVTADTIVVGDGFVRVQTDNAVEVDWRSAGNIAVRATDDLLVQLGGSREQDHITLSMAGDILFDFGESGVRPDAAERLAQIAQLIRNEVHGEVVIVGHTDSMGTDSANQALSEQRAVSVIRWLIEQEGIPGAMLLGRGMGERQPLAPNAHPDGNDNPAGRARNRRVDLYLATKQSADVRDLVVSVTGDKVDVGDVASVDDSGNVRVGDVGIAADGTVDLGGLAAVAGAPASGTVSCAAGKTCNQDCPDGGCQMICPAGAICTYGCRGGNCTMTCSAGGRCDLSCAGGNCRFQCATGSTCATSCSGGDCTGG